MHSTNPFKIDIPRHKIASPELVHVWDDVMKTSRLYDVM